MIDNFAAWTFDFNKYVSYKLNLFNSMITFNSLLLASLSIINGINSISCPILLLPFLISAFVPILLVICMLSHLAEISLLKSNELYSRLMPSSPPNTTVAKDVNEKKHNGGRYEKEKQRFQQFCKKAYIPWSIFNFIYFLALLHI